MDIERDLQRIEQALALARKAVAKYTPGRIDADRKAGGDPVTAADLELDEVLKQTLCIDDDGWLSEETRDNPARRGKHRVWIVDPIDGTKEFIQGIPEWCISVGLAVDGKVVAGGICNPQADQLIIGAAGAGVTMNGIPVRTTDKDTLEGATVLASRSEIKRGEWDRFMDGPLKVVPSGSVAYKLAAIAAGLADSTFTLVPKNEWDIAAGVALIEAAGGRTMEKQGGPLTFNNPNTLITGMIAAGANLFEPLRQYLGL